ncbi:response regulator transcription factor [Anaerosoma tenue]|uniref:response regulator transcription factor n=1 Tax=Anaerosoma tenue TaxID=2933588 RepID=UPI002260B144|nr:response regulator transcription factor [Anaerosoma tenue]MCK8113988.1 response regulator transcription factor [Anaerosoma tenue]
MSREVLVVDDNDKIVEVLTAYLEQEGFVVRTASDGPSAVAEVERAVPDIALLDVMLPGIDGIELTKRFQKEHDLPVILVTARSDEVDRLIGLEVGADDYVSKPFSPREVVARVKAVLRRAEGPRSAGEALRIGALIIDLGRRSVSVDGVVADLTRTEFDILAAMAAHPGRVYTRLQLLEIATGDTFEGYERTIDAHVKNIRKKLGDDPRRPRYVHTVFGVGYKVEAPE